MHGKVRASHPLDSFGGVIFLRHIFCLFPMQRRQKVPFSLRERPQRRCPDIMTRGGCIMQGIRVTSQSDVHNYTFSQKQNEESSLQSGGVAGRKGDVRLTTVSADTLSISSEARAALERNMAQAEQNVAEAQQRGDAALKHLKSLEGKNISLNGKDLLQYVQSEYDKVCQEQGVSELPYYKRDDCQKIYDKLAEEGWGSPQGARASYTDSAWDRLIFNSISTVVRKTLSSAQAEYTAQQNALAQQNTRPAALSSYAPYKGINSYSKFHLTA